MNIHDIKVYNTKSYYNGIFFLALATVNLLIVISNFDSATSLILPALLFFMGGNDLHIALNKTRAEERRKHENNPRTIAINAKARGSALIVLRWLTFFAGLILLLMGSHNESDILLGVGFGNMAVFTLTLFIEFITYAYYSNKM